MWHDIILSAHQRKRRVTETHLAMLNGGIPGADDEAFLGAGVVSNGGDQQAHDLVMRGHKDNRNGIV